MPAHQPLRWAAVAAMAAAVLCGAATVATAAPTPNAAAELSQASVAGTRHHSTATNVARSTTAPAGALPPFRNWTLPLPERVADLVAQLTLSEKLGLLSTGNAAIDRLNVSAFNFGNECLHGVKNSIPGDIGATIFPQPMALAATWDTALIHTIGNAIGREARALRNRGGPVSGTQFGNCFAPNINIVRDPRWGRSAETYGEDPTLTSQFATAMITGLQGNASESKYLLASSTVKHFAAYSLEEAEGDTRFAFNAVVSAQDFADTYYPAFKAAVVDSEAAALMCSYNACNGVPSCASPELLQGQLRGTWQFNGSVISDCGAVGFAQTAHHYTSTLPQAAAKSLLAGTDVDCGNGYAVMNESLAQGLVTEHDIDVAVSRSLTMRFRMGEFDPPAMNPYTKIPVSEVGSAAHMTLARTAAQESVVVLKNSNLASTGKPVLPLDKTKITKVAVIGPQANDTEVVLGNYHGNPYGGAAGIVTPLDAITNAVGAERVVYQQGCWVVGEGTWKFEDAITAATDADVALVFVGSSSKGSNLTFPELLDIATEKESLDRRHIDLPGAQMDLVRALAKRTTTPIVLVLVNGNSLDVSWAQASPRVAGIAAAWYPGQQGANGVADVLFGDVSASGKLPVTFYYDNFTAESSMTSMDMRAYPGRTHRFLQVPVLYEFGYGLSYTTFEYSGVNVVTNAPSTSGGDAVATVRAVVTNTGDVDADEVVQVYVSLQRASVAQHQEALRPGDATYAHRPASKELRAFRRVSLAAGGGSADLEFSLTRDDFAVAMPDGSVEAVPGTWIVTVGGVASEVDVQLGL